MAPGTRATRSPRRLHRQSSMSDSDSSSTPEAEIEDDTESADGNDSQSSLSVSLDNMDLDEMAFEELCRQSPINRLPAEILIQVFSKLSGPADLKNCMLCCKTWARNCVDLLWHRPTTSSWDHLIKVIKTVRKEDGFFAYHDLIKRLNLGQLKEEVSDGVLVPLACCKRIERLTLPGCKHLTDHSVKAMVEGNKSLLAVDVSELDLITDASMYTIANNCYKLQGLNISNCNNVTDDSLVAIAQSCRRVKRLKFNECPQLTDRSILAFADNCQDILELDLCKCSNITDMSVTALLEKGRQLRELRLAQCTRLTDEAFLQLHLNERFEALRILDLTDCNELQDAGLRKIIQCAPRLRNLALAKCRNITDQGVIAISKLGKNLHFLHLGHCSNITDYGVSYLVKYCTRIRYIDFSVCSNLTDESVVELKNLTRLKRIGLVKCHHITDRSLRALAAPRSTCGGLVMYASSLERLHLSYCTNLTIQGVRHLLMNCPQLTHLSLTGVQPFLREDMLEFIRDPPNEFNEHQRTVFCVFSGPGVHKLREWLIKNYPSPAPSEPDADDDDLTVVPAYDEPQLIDLSPVEGLEGITDTATNAPPPPLHHHHTNSGVFAMPGSFIHVPADPHGGLGAHMGMAHSLPTTFAQMHPNLALLQPGPVPGVAAAMQMHHHVGMPGTGAPENAPHAMDSPDEDVDEEDDENDLMTGV